jgi:hypothetical protein
MMKSGDEEEDNEEYYEAREKDETEDNSQDSDEEEGFGTLLLRCWQRRSESLVHTYSAIAGWIHSPCKEIQQDVKKSISYSDIQGKRELLVK